MMKSLAAMMMSAAMMSSQVKGFETECNFINYDGTPIAVEVCMATGAGDTGYRSQKATCQSGDIQLSVWTDSSSCAGTATATLDLEGIADLYGIDSSSILWKCDGSKSTDECGYVIWRHSVLSSELACNSVVKYSTTPILTNVCSPNGPFSIIAGCDSTVSPNELMIGLYFSSNCSGSAFSVSQGDLCQNGTYEQYTCHNCDGGGCSPTSMPDTTVEGGDTTVGDTTMPETSMMSVCPYATVVGLPNAMDRCATTVTPTSAYGEKYLCDDNGQLILKRWIQSTTCSEGAVETYDTSMIGSMNNDTGISWVCGDANDDYCSHTYVVVYDAASCDDEEYYREVFLVNGVCTSYMDYPLYTDVACEDDIMTYTLYGESTCAHSQFNITTFTQCSITGANATDVSKGFVSCLNDGQTTTTKLQTTSTSHVTTTGSGTTTTGSGTTTTGSEETTTTSSEETTKPGTTSSANAFNSMCCVIVSLFFLSFMTL